MDPFIGTVIMFAGNFAPRGWAFCDGQLLSISSNSALFSILGTTYGGDGRTTFGLPDLRGRAPVHAGSGPGLTTRSLGTKSGAEAVTLTEAQIASHNHNMGVANAIGTTDAPAGNVLARPRVAGADPPVNAYTTPQNEQLKADAITMTGGGQSHANMPPFLVINFIIALVGIFPSRN